MKEKIEFGNFDLCLRVKNLEVSTEFYKKLGFEGTTYEPVIGMSILKRHDITLALYSDYIDETILNFRGGNISEIVTHLESNGLKSEAGVIHEDDGSKSAKFRDPDGNLIYYNTAPGEELS